MLAQKIASRKRIGVKADSRAGSQVSKVDYARRLREGTLFGLQYRQVLDELERGIVPILSWGRKQLSI